MNLQNLAREFDLPIDSREHLLLEQTAWMGGPLVSVRFYLGRLVGSNLFRESDSQVEDRLMTFISQITSTAGGNLVRSLQGWSVAADLLRYRFEMQTKGESGLKRLEIAAIEKFLVDPALPFHQLANDVGTTEKQLRRNSGLTVARKILAPH